MKWNLEIIAKIDGKDWKFNWGSPQMPPKFPLLATGIATNEGYPHPHLIYAVDSSYRIWIGNMQDEMRLADGGASYALDMLFDFNIISWARVCRLLGDERVNEITRRAKKPIQDA